MASRPASLLAQLKRIGLSLPGTRPKSPWPRHDDVAVNNKTFAYPSTARMPLVRSGRTFTGGMCCSRPLRRAMSSGW